MSEDARWRIFQYHVEAVPPGFPTATPGTIVVETEWALYGGIAPRIGGTLGEAREWVRDYAARMPGLFVVRDGSNVGAIESTWVDGREVSCEGCADRLPDLRLAARCGGGG